MPRLWPSAGGGGQSSRQDVALRQSRTKSRVSALSLGAGEPVSSKMSDEELLARIARGNADAFDILYDRHAAYVNGVCYQFLRSREESEEILQEIFLELWDGRLRYQPGLAALTTWLFRIAKNRCLDRLKSSARRLPHGPVPEDLVDPEGGVDPAADAQLSEERARVRDALDALSAEQREAIETCFFRSRTYREAAEVLHIPLGTLKGRIRLAMAKLAAMLTEEDDTP